MGSNRGGISRNKGKGDITVQLINRHALVGAGVRCTLEREPDMKVVVESGSAHDGIRDFFNHHPQVVIVEADFPEGTGLEISHRIRERDAGARIIFLSTYGDNVRTLQAMKAGASGYLTMGCHPEELVKAVRCGACGDVYLESRVAQRLALHQLGRNPDPYEVLSDRDFEVFLMLANGRNVRQIADSLCLSPKTVSTSRTRVLKRLEAPNVAVLAHMAIRYGLIAA